MYLRKFATVVALAIFLPACASITRGTHEALVVESDPGGADVSLSNGETCTTPCSIKLKRKHGVYVSVTKQGYQTVDTVVNTEIAGGGAAGMAGNVLLGGLIGAGVDASTGAMNKFVPNPLEVDLTPLGDGETAADPVVMSGESFHFKSYAETGEKLPFDEKERKEAMKNRDKAIKEADEGSSEEDADSVGDSTGKEGDEPLL